MRTKNGVLVLRQQGSWAKIMADTAAENSPCQWWAGQRTRALSTGWRILDAVSLEPLDGSYSRDLGLMSPEK